MIQLQLDLIGSVNKLKSSECLCMKREMDNSCQPTSKIGQENAARLIENSQTFSKTKLAFEWDLQILVKDK